MTSILGGRRARLLGLLLVGALLCAFLISVSPIAAERTCKTPQCNWVKDDSSCYMDSEDCKFIRKVMINGVLVSLYKCTGRQCCDWKYQCCNYAPCGKTGCAEVSCDPPTTTSERCTTIRYYTYE